MPKAEKSWSGMRKYLEQEMLAPSLAGRVRYDCAAYPGMGHAICFQVFVDGERVSMFSMESMAKALLDGEKAGDLGRFWAAYWDAKRHVPLEERGAHDDMEFAAALRTYRSADIAAALSSSDPIVRMFAVMDRRVGKRTLQKLKEQADAQPQWLRFYYNLRLSAEGIIPA